MLSHILFVPQLCQSIVAGRRKCPRSTVHMCCSVLATSVMFCSNYYHYALWTRFSSKKEHFNHNREHFNGNFDMKKLTRVLTAHIRGSRSGYTPTNTDCSQAGPGVGARCRNHRTIITMNVLLILKVWEIIFSSRPLHRCVMYRSVMYRPLCDEPFCDVPFCDVPFCAPTGRRLVN
jgi:hypothetical protein